MSLRKQVPPSLFFLEGAERLVRYLGGYFALRPLDHKLMPADLLTISLLGHVVMALCIFWFLWGEVLAGWIRCSECHMELVDGENIRRLLAGG